MPRVRLIIVSLTGQDQTLTLGNQVFVGLDQLLSFALPIDFNIVMAALELSKRLLRMCRLLIEPSNLCIEFSHANQYAPLGWTGKPFRLSSLGRAAEAATDCLRQALRVAPDYADAVFNLALLLQRKNQYAEATDYWRRYLASDCRSAPRRIVS